MKVLFLDIDGVLNNDFTKEKHNGWTGVDNKLVQRFLLWQEKHPDLHVVLTSTWRLPIHFNEGATEYLNSKGIFWIDVTPNMPEYGRGMEINAWLMNNLDVSHFAILDDIMQMRPVHNNLVKVSPKYGLRDKDLVKVDRLLAYD